MTQQELSDEYYDLLDAVKYTAIWYMLLTPELRYDEDLAYCPRCSSPMKWNEFNNENGHYFDAHCTNPDCSFTDGT